MTGLGRGIGPAMVALALAFAAPAGAQENLDQGKTGAQLYAADCAICHKSPQALNKSAGMFGLSSFLREHYTASKESAASIAAYIQSVGSTPAPSKRTGAAKRAAKGEDKGKLDDEKKSKAKSGDAKVEEKGKADEEKKTKPKTGEAKSDKSGKSEKTHKPDEAKRSEPKGESKPEQKTEKKTEKKSSETKANTKSDSKSGEPKPKDAKVKDAKGKDAKADDAEAAPPKQAKDKKKSGSAAEAKPDKKEKSDHLTPN